jgi:hypothetical protein
MAAAVAGVVWARPYRTVLCVNSILGSQQLALGRADEQKSVQLNNWRL